MMCDFGLCFSLFPNSVAIGPIAAFHEHREDGLPAWVKTGWLFTERSGKTLYVNRLLLSQLMERRPELTPPLAYAFPHQHQLILLVHPLSRR